MIRTIKILVVEDNPGDVRLIKEAIRSVGIHADIQHCDTAKAGMQSIQAYKEGMPDVPDVMLLDYNLPGGTACDMLLAARRNPALSRAKKAVLTCSVAPRDRDQSIAAGADMFVFKPSDLDSFLANVGSALRLLVGVD